MVDRIEEGGDIGIHHPTVSLPNGSLYHAQCRGRTPFGSETVAARAEYSLEDRFEHLAECLLHDPIAYGGDTQRPLPSCAFRNEDTPDRKRSVGLLAQVLAQ